MQQDVKVQNRDHRRESLKSYILHLLEVLIFSFVNLFNDAVQLQKLWIHECSVFECIRVEHGEGLEELLLCRTS
jgi:hypothetical protein